MAQKGPPPPVVLRPGAQPPNNAQSVYDPSITSSPTPPPPIPPPDPTATTECPRHQPEPLIPAQTAEVSEPDTDATQSPPAVRAVPLRRRVPIAFKPEPRGPRAQALPAPPPHPTAVPEQERPKPTVAKAVPPTVIIGQFRAVEQHEKSWAMPKRVGSMVPAMDVPGLGYVRYAGTIAVIVDSVETDLHTGKKTVYVSVCYGPDPGNGVLKRKFRSKSRERMHQLEAAIACAFTTVTPVCGLVLRLIGGPPTMTDQEMHMAGYTARAGVNRAPVRAELTFEAIQSREEELKELYRKVQGYFDLWRVMLLMWWWTFNRARLSAYRTGERLVDSEGGAQGSLTVVRRSLVDAKQHAVVERDVAELAKRPVASYASLLWEDPALRAALVEKGVNVEQIAGTRLGTIMDDEEDFSRK